MDCRLIGFAGLMVLMWSVPSDAGVSYVRWGRTACPVGVHTLYKGYMAGHHTYGKGGGANILCSAAEPKFVRGQPGHQDYAGELVGIELALTPTFENLFLHDNVNGDKLTAQDLPCVVCYLGDSSDVLMIPGRDDCYQTGYDLQYKGFLVSEVNWVDRQPSEFLCLDEAPEGRPGGAGALGGPGASQQGSLYPVEYTCGVLPCNPYVNQNEATCAVCAY